MVAQSSAEALAKISFLERKPQKSNATMDTSFSNGSPQPDLVLVQEPEGLVDPHQGLKNRDSATNQKET
jgi:hypothetical protein